MKKVILLFITSVAVFFMVGCSSIKLSPKQQALIDNQTELYTQVNMWMQKGKVIGTNYGQGLFIPINTKIKIVNINAKTINFMYRGEVIRYYTYTKFTRLKSPELVNRLFSSKAVDLSKFSSLGKKKIKFGKVAIGMTKDEVIAARGYPPFHATTSLESDQWRYWRTRWAQAVVIFENGKVIRLEGSPS